MIDQPCVHEKGCCNHTCKNYSLFCQAPLNSELVCCLSRTARGNLPPLAAAVGGLASQEALKAITGKFAPLQQWVCQKQQIETFYKEILNSVVFVFLILSLGIKIFLLLLCCNSTVLS